jgi:hypothetical protein
VEADEKYIGKIVYKFTSFGNQWLLVHSAVGKELIMQRHAVEAIISVERR